MHTITRPPDTAAEDAIRAHLNNLLADAREHNDRAVFDELTDEADLWAHDGQVTPARAGEILASASPDERVAVAVHLILGALDARDLATACRLVDQTVNGDRDVLNKLAKALAATVDVPAGTVVWGHGIDVWANPHRYGYAWRCGDCRWTASNYTTPDAVRGAAGEHAAEHDADSRPVVRAYGEETRP